MENVGLRSSLAGRRDPALWFARASGLLCVGNGDSSSKNGEDCEKVGRLRCVMVTPLIGAGVDIVLISSFVSDCVQFINVSARLLSRSEVNLQHAILSLGCTPINTARQW